MSAMSIIETNRALLPDELDCLLRKSLKCAMAARGLNEESLAAELTKRLGHAINPASVNAWKADTKHKWSLPAKYIPVLCEILENDSIQRLLMSEKLRHSLELGESTSRVVSLLQSALPEATEPKEVEGGKKPKRSKR